MRDLLSGVFGLVLGPEESRVNGDGDGDIFLVSLVVCSCA